MTARYKVPLPKAIFAVWEALSSSCTPVEVPSSLTSILNSVESAFMAELDPSPTIKPSVILNRSFGQIRRQHPEAFKELHKWLATEQVVLYFSDYGLYWAWSIWLRAASLLIRGATASVAFGADKPGRSKLRVLSKYDDAAFLVLEAHIRNPDMPLSMVIDETVEYMHEPQTEGFLDQRDLRRAYASLLEQHLSNDEITTQATIARLKYRKS